MALLLLATTTGAARAACPAAPIGDPDDMAISFLAANGVQAASASLLSASNVEGTLVYDDASDTLKVCDGNNWIPVGSGGGGDTLASLSCAAGEIAKYNGSAWACAADGGGTGGGATSSMVTGWPDAILCSGANGSATFDLAWLNTTGSAGYTLRGDYGNNTNSPRILFSSLSAGGSLTETASWPGWATSCDGKTITQLYTDGKAFNFIGGGGGGSDTLAGLSCSSGQIPKWNGTAWACANDSSDDGASMSGAVMAFNASTCPNGWTEYLPARGRFLRGIDNGAGNDPDGTRAAGSLQADLIGEHRHDVGVSDGTVGSGTGIARASNNSNVTSSNKALTSGTSMGAETRPKNVAVIFCQYNGTGGLSGGGGGGSPAVAFHVHKNGTNQTTTSGVEAVITWSTEAFDTNNNFASNRFTPTVAGKYLITLSAYGVNGVNFARIYKNTTNVAEGYNSGSNSVVPVTTVVDMNGTTDYIEARFLGTGTTTLEGLANHTYMTGFLLGGGSDTLAGLSCSSGQIPKWNGTAWACAADGGGASSGAAGYVQLSGGSGAFADSGTTAGEQLFWDNTNKRLGIGTVSPAASALLDMTSTTRGFLPPRMTTIQRNAIASPAEGLVVYNTTTKSLDLRLASSWLTFSGNQTGNTMVSGWPDAINCPYDEAGTWRDWIYTYGFYRAGTGEIWYQSSNATGVVDFIKFNATTGAWVSKTNSSVMQCTSQSIAQLYAAGKAFNFVGGSTASADGTAGQLQFNEGGNLKADTALHWDNTNKRLGIGTATPPGEGRLTVIGSASTGILSYNTTGGVLIGYGAGNTIQGRGANGTGNVDLALNSYGGNVGIGTATPQSMLEVAGGVQLGDDAATCPGTGSVKLGTLRFNGGNLQICVAGGWTGIAAGSVTAAGSDGSIQFKSGTNLAADATNLHWDDANNRLGIGTTSPGYSLDVNGNIRGSLIVRPGGTYTNGSIFSDGNWGMLFRSAQVSPAIAAFSFADSDNNKLMSIRNDGNVGIGTNAPAAKLHVDGGIIVGGTGSEVCNASTNGMMIHRGAFFFVCANGAGGWKMIQTTEGSTAGTGGYFVLSGSTNGNMGGLAGADALCLSRLMSLNWKGKESAAFRDLLKPANVKAFLCDGSTCNNLAPNETYTFAQTGSDSVGGDTFTTDGSGAGPNNTTTWTGGTRFCISDGYGGCVGVSIWTGRNTGTNSLWATTAHGNTCTSWSTTSGNGRYGLSGVSNSGRWSYGSLACNNAGMRLVCVVNP